MAFDSSTFETDVLATITAIDSNVSSFSADDIDRFYSIWIRSAWDVGCTYADSEDPDEVVEGVISGGAITTEDDAYWGMDHFTADFKDTLLNGTALFPYNGVFSDSVDNGASNDSRSRIFVVSNEKIFKFTSVPSNYFASVREAVHNFMAAEYFDETTGTQSGNDSAIHKNTANGNGEAAYSLFIE